jgi:hypothetical protein
MKVSAFLRRLLTSDEELAARDLQERSARLGCTAIADCRAGERVVASGHLRSVTLRPRRSVRALEAELFDGSGTLRVVWLGRRAIGGIEPGRAITVEGRIVMGEDRRPTVFNPRYELQPRSGS